VGQEFDSGVDRLWGKRFSAQLLEGSPARSVVDVVERLLAVQAQDQLGFRLAIRARSAGLTVGDVDRALSIERSVLVTWVNRGTLHLIRARDYGWLHPLLTPPLFKTNARRLWQEGVSAADADRAVDLIVRAVTEDGPQTRQALGDRLASAGAPVAGQALVHVLTRASLLGHVVRGPMVDGEHAYVLVRDWLGHEPSLADRDVVLAQLARRYLVGHGPASDRDLAKWSGLPLRDCRRGLSFIGKELSHRADGLFDLVDGRQDQIEPSQPRLLGPFEPLLLGWTSRQQILGDHGSLVTSHGVFRPFAVVRRRAVATWRLVRRDVVLEPFAPLGSDDRASLQADAADVKRFLKKA
jgi:hypothetical protein